MTLHIHVQYYTHDVTCDNNMKTPSEILPRRLSKQGGCKAQALVELGKVLSRGLWQGASAAGKQTIKLFDNTLHYKTVLP